MHDEQCWKQRAMKSSLREVWVSRQKLATENALGLTAQEKSDLIQYLMSL